MDAEDSIKKIDEILDSYENQIGMATFNPEAYGSNGIDKYLNMSKQQLEALDPEECAIAAVMLSSFAFHIQRSYNREIARISWAESRLNKIVAGKELMYRGSWDSQKMQAIKEDSVLEKLNSIATYAKQRADRFNSLSYSIKNLADKFDGLKRAKELMR